MCRCIFKWANVSITIKYVYNIILIIIKLFYI
nr:MAG TPA: hypothetical protein [Caudoviricetes sp.]